MRTPLAPRRMADCIERFMARRKATAALELLGDVLGHQLGVGLGLADLDDVQVNLAVGHRGQVLARASRCRRPSCR